jgi:NAD-dependent deacetylase
MADLDFRISELAREALAADGPIVFLTGAGISAESGIPTFRGTEGYWQVGSRNYHPQELATHASFQEMPEEVWAWYLYRRGVCRAAQPNDAHHALVRCERALGDRFLLVTQNVDGLHRRAGNSAARTYEVHGNTDHLRCEDEHPAVRPIPEGIAVDWPKDKKTLDRNELALLRCPTHQRLTRPHVLWFDESYDEPLFRFDSSLAAASTAAMMVVVGTSGSTTLPVLMVQMAARRGIPLICINQDESPFTAAARASRRGLVMLGAATIALPKIVAALGGGLGGASGYN